MAASPPTNSHGMAGSKVLRTYVTDKSQRQVSTKAVVDTAWQKGGLCSSVMKTLLIVYHSTTGGARQMAHAAAAGAKTEGAAVQTRLLYATDAAPEDVLSADAFIFAAPENLASMSGQASSWRSWAGMEPANRRSCALRWDCIQSKAEP